MWSFISLSTRLDYNENFIPHLSRKLQNYFHRRWNKVFFECVCKKVSPIFFFTFLPTMLSMLNSFLVKLVWQFSFLSLYGHGQHERVRERFQRIKLHHQIDKLCLASLHMSSDGHRHRCWERERVNEGKSCKIGIIWGTSCRTVLLQKTCSWL